MPGKSTEFWREYHYNSPGILTFISDPFLSETIDFTEEGYGQGGYGDGIVMRTFFNASWTNSGDTDDRNFIVQPNIGPVECLEALKNLGYIAPNGKPVKAFVPTAENGLPLTFGGSIALKLAQHIATRLPPTLYGHRYAYGNHQELLRAKYFTDLSYDKDIEPLRLTSFAKRIPSLTLSQVKEIWTQLKKSGFIVTDQVANFEDGVGKPGRQPLLREADLLRDLEAAEEKYVIYREPLQRFLLKAVSERRDITTSQVEEVVLKWWGGDPGKKAEADQVAKILHDEGYLHCSNVSSILNPELVTALNNFQLQTQDIVKVMVDSFINVLGSSPCDLEAYESHANGNQVKFYRGFDRVITLNIEMGPTKSNV